METLIVTGGFNKRNSKGKLIELNTGQPVLELKKWLEQEHETEEAWWSGHLWEDNDRGKRLPENKVKWLGMQCLVVDVDHYSDAKNAKERHAAPSDSLRSKLDKARIPCSMWHHTPRGARFVFVLEDMVVDPEKAGELAKGGAGLINTHLRQAGICANLNSRKKPIGGYYADAQTRDLARFMFRPNTFIDGVERSAHVVVIDTAPIKLDEIIVYKDKIDVEPVSEVGSLLAREPCEGENDGSMQLIKVARKAIRLGICEPDLFVQASKAWNSKRVVPWSDYELKKRFEDAWTRFSEEHATVIHVPRNDNGNPIYSANILDKILREDGKYKDKFRMNVRGLVPEFNEKPFTDGLIFEIRTEIESRYGFNRVRKEDVWDGVKRLFEENEYDPVKNYLESLEWDGQERIKRICSEVLYIEDEEALEIGEVYLKKWLIGAVARAFEPGCKFDTVLIFVGRQGLYKSGFFEALASRPFFTDTGLDLYNKDTYMVVASTWVYEFSEFDAIYKKADIARIRGFFSSQGDKFRPPYGRTTQYFPRRCVFAGTSNEHEVILDSKGDRRYWVLEVDSKVVNLDLAREWRDQLWAEAFHYYQEGEQWYLTPKEETLRSVSNEIFKPEEPEKDKFREVIRELEADPEYEGYLRLGSLTSKIWPWKTGKLQYAEKTLLTSTLKEMGYKYGRRRIKGSRPCVWNKIK